MRRTVRSSLRTDGIPFHLVVKAPRPDRVRLLLIADVSLSVRPITAFTLRLACGQCIAGLIVAALVRRSSGRRDRRPARQ